MPVKQRRRKARAFDEYHREQLIDGPSASLIAGVGYSAGQPAHYDQLPDSARAAVLADMEADWHIHGPDLLRWWTAEGGEGLPWAAEQFGLPGDEQCQ